MVDWSDAVAEEEEKEEQRHRGYYTDSVVQGGRPRRGGQGRGGRARYAGNYQHPGRRTILKLSSANSITMLST